MDENENINKKRQVLIFDDRDPSDKKWICGTILNVSEEFYPKEVNEEEFENVDMRPIFEAKCGFRKFVEKGEKNKNAKLPIKLDPETLIHY